MPNIYVMDIPDIVRNRIIKMLEDMDIPYETTTSSDYNCNMIADKIAEEGRKTNEQ